MESFAKKLVQTIARKALRSIGEELRRDMYSYNELYKS